MIFSFCAWFCGVSSSMDCGVWPHCTGSAGCKHPRSPLRKWRRRTLLLCFDKFYLAVQPAFPIPSSWCKPFCRAPIIPWIYGSYFQWHVVAGQTNQVFARMPKQFLLILVSMRKGGFRRSNNRTSLHFAACATLPVWVFFMRCSESILCLISSCWVNHSLRYSPGPLVWEQTSLFSSAFIPSCPICLSDFLPLVFRELCFSGPNISTWPLCSLRICHSSNPRLPTEKLK